MASDVKVTIDLITPTGKAGWGIPLLLAGKATANVAYIECSSLSDVLTAIAGYAAGDTDSDRAAKTTAAQATNMYKAANLLFMQDDAPSKIAICETTDAVGTWLASGDNQSRNWRQLVVVSLGETGETSIADICTAVEAIEGKMFFFDVPTATETNYSTNNYDRSVAFFVDTTTTYPVPVAALVGATAGLDVGSFTYKNIELKGIAAQSLLDSAITAIHGKGGITFVAKAGNNVTSEGKVTGGEYIDIIDSKDYIILQLEYQTQRTLNSNLKIPYDNNGIAMLENVAVTVLRDCYNNGIIANDVDGNPDYSVDYARREETDSNDRVIRSYVGGKFSFSLAGAIHDVEITGEILI